MVAVRRDAGYSWFEDAEYLLTVSFGMSIRAAVPSTHTYCGTRRKRTDFSERRLTS
jgi:hypothetical protein